LRPLNQEFSISCSLAHIKTMQSETTSLYDLLHSRNLSTDFEGFIEEVLRDLVEEMEVSIASFWLIDEVEEKFYCVRSFDKTLDSFSRGQIISRNQQEQLYSSICDHDIISVSDVHSDPVFDAGIGKLMSRSTLSWMNMLDYLGGRIFGFIRVDSSQIHHWNDRSNSSLLTALSLINQSYYANHYEQVDEDGKRKTTKELAYLEQIKEKISEYAFFTAHNIRHPLTNIISLMDMLKELDDDKTRREELLGLLKIEVLKLDEVVRVMIVKLELE